MAEQPIIVKKIKSHGHGHHGGSWKVAYADFVTAMMAFFMVMWIMGLSDETRAQIQGYFNDPVGFMKNTPRSRNVIPVNGSPKTKPSSDTGAAQGQLEKATRMAREEQEAAKMREEIEKAMQSQASSSGAPSEEQQLQLKQLLDDVEITITEEGLRIEFIEREGEVFFELGSAKILPEAKKLIAKIAPVLGKSGKPLLIDGHTDARPYPSANYDNWNLSGDRADALRRALCATGVKEAQILGVRARAATELRKPDDPYHSSNRRVSILVPYHPQNESVGPLPSDNLRAETEGEFPVERSVDPR